MTINRAQRQLFLKAVHSAPPPLAAAQAAKRNSGLSQAVNVSQKRRAETARRPRLIMT